MEQIVNIYIGNAAKSLKRQRARGIYLLESVHHPGKTLHDTIELEKVTINEMELALLEQAISKITKKCKIHIYTNNNYLAAAFRNDWVTQWKNNGFLSEKRQEIANKSRWESILRMLGDTKPEIHLKEKHSYTKWMEGMLRE